MIASFRFGYLSRLSTFPFAIIAEKEREREREWDEFVYVLKPKLWLNNTDSYLHNYRHNTSAYTRGSARYTTYIFPISIRPPIIIECDRLSLACHYTVSASVIIPLRVVLFLSPILLARSIFLSLSWDSHEHGNAKRLLMHTRRMMVYVRGKCSFNVFFSFLSSLLFFPSSSFLRFVFGSFFSSPLRLLLCIISLPHFIAAYSLSFTGTIWPP